MVGSGYVGMSLSVLLALHNDVLIHDIDKEKIKKINKKESTVADREIQLFLNEKKLCLKATSNKKLAYKDANFIIVATPTNFDPDTNSFDTTSVDSVVKDALMQNDNAAVIIKSTIPIGYTKLLRAKFKTDRIIFSPEFLREGKALYDNLYPSRIIVGSYCKSAKKFAGLLKRAAQKESVELLYMHSDEAEATKLFANSYLAMRVSFFNELDSFALANNYNSKNIIEGVCLDERIGGYYNNPSFGYGGYCLPKDTKQLLMSYRLIPQALIEAIVESNSKRKDFLANEILRMQPKIVGIYGLSMKKDSDNYRSSAIQDIIRILKAKDVKVIIYDQLLKKEKFFMDSKILTNLEEFKELSDVIVTNRRCQKLADVSSKLFTRDLYGVN